MEECARRSECGKPGLALLLVSSRPLGPSFPFPGSFFLSDDLWGHFRLKEYLLFWHCFLGESADTQEVLKLCQMNGWVSSSELSGFYSVNYKLRLCPSSTKSFSSTCSFSIPLIVVPITTTHGWLFIPHELRMPGFPVFHYFLFAQTHIHWASNAIQPSHPLESGLFKWAACQQAVWWTPFPMNPDVVSEALSEYLHPVISGTEWLLSIGLLWC